MLTYHVYGETFSVGRT